MIMTLKLAGLAFEINSAATASEDDPEGANSDAMKAGIGFLDVFHYSFSYMGILTGPYYRYRTYWDSLHRPMSKYVDAWPLTFYKLKQVVVFGVLFLIAQKLFPTRYILTDDYAALPFILRVLYIYPVFAVFRLRMFIGMVLSECVCQMSGVGAYPARCNTQPGLGPKDYKTVVELSSDKDKLKKEEFDFNTVHNMDVWAVETCISVRTAMKVWNACIQYWMATCVYKRFPSKSLRTVVTMLLSALWHGYAAGYYFCICQIPFFLPFEDICMKFYKQANEDSITRKLLHILLFWTRLSCMAYLGIPFLLLNFNEIIYYYKSLYFSGHFLLLFMYIVCRLLKPIVLKKPVGEKHRGIDVHLGADGLPIADPAKEKLN